MGPKQDRHRGQHAPTLKETTPLETSLKTSTISLSTCTFGRQFLWGDLREERTIVFVCAFGEYAKLMSMFTSSSGICRC